MVGYAVPKTAVGQETPYHAVGHLHARSAEPLQIHGSTSHGHIMLWGNGYRT